MIGSSPARSRMRMRCSIERQYQMTRDSFGQKVGDWREMVGWVPCHVWASPGGREAVSPERTVSVDVPRMIVPAGTDVTANDRIASVIDKAGNRLFGPLAIVAVQRRITHLELTLTEIK